MICPNCGKQASKNELCPHCGASTDFARRSNIRPDVLPFAVNLESQPVQAKMHERGFIAGLLVSMCVLVICLLVTVVLNIKVTDRITELEARVAAAEQNYKQEELMGNQVTAQTDQEPVSDGREEAAEQNTEPAGNKSTQPDQEENGAIIGRSNVESAVGQLVEIAPEEQIGPNINTDENIKNKSDKPIEKKEDVDHERTGDSFSQPDERQGQ